MVNSAAGRRDAGLGPILRIPICGSLSRFDLGGDVFSRAAEQSLEAAVEPEFAPVLAHEVEDQAPILSGALPEAATELLEEQRRAVRRPQEQEGIDVREVYPFIEEVDREEDSDITIAQVL